MTAFEEFGVMPEIAKAVEELDWTLPTDVQAEAIPLILGGGDVLMAAETGSGKTGAFCLPILQIVWETLRDIESGKGSGGGTTKAVNSTPWIMSFHDRGAAMAVSPDGLRCQAREQKEWHGTRCTRGVKNSGKWYFEATVTDEGLCRVGWSMLQANLDLGTCRFGFGFGGTGKKSNNKQFDNYGEAFGKCDVIGNLLDLDNGEIKFTKNGQDLGLAFKINPQIKAGPFFPAVVLKNAEMSFNFGSTPFKYDLPAGYQAVCSAPNDKVAMNTNGASSSSSEASSKPAPNAPKAIIIEPSRELAEQTSNQLAKFKKYLEAPKVKELVVIGGVSVKEQIGALNSGIDLVVGTPGRLEDLIQGGHLALTNVRFFVLDEADGLLKSGYTDLINRIHKQIPKITSDGHRLQMIVCSATLHDFEVKKLAERLMHFPTWVDLKGEDAVPETVHHVVCMVDPQKDTSWQNLRRHIQTDGVHNQDNVGPRNNSPETLSEAIKMLKGEYCIRAIEKHNMDRAIIFCRTKLDCDNLERYLKQCPIETRFSAETEPSAMVAVSAETESYKMLSNNNYLLINVGGNKYSCVCLHGDRKPNERKANLEKFKRSEAKFLICTDVAARGLDITGLPYMINVTLPDEKSNYVHRIGRVGRAERMGLAISLVSTVPEKVWYHGEWCATRGRNCWNTRLTDEKGCCMWYNELRYLAEIEDHLNITIEQVDKDISVPMNDFDGKVVYGEKLKGSGSNYAGHVAQMAPAVAQLAALESNAQNIFIQNMIAAK